MRALYAPEVQDLIEGAATTLETTAAREADVRSTIRLAAATLPPPTRILGRLDGTLDRADPLLAKLRDPARDVAPTTAALQPVVVDATRLLGRARPLLRALRPTTRRLASTAVAGLPLLRELNPSLQRLDEQALPRLALKNSESGLRTYELVGAAVAGVDGAAAGFDHVSNLIRQRRRAGDRLAAVQDVLHRPHRRAADPLPVAG